MRGVGKGILRLASTQVTWHVVMHVSRQRPSGGYHVTKVQKLHAGSRTALLTSLKAKLRL